MVLASHCHLPFQHVEDLVESYRTWDHKGVRGLQCRLCGKPLAMSVPAVSVPAMSVPVVSRCSFSMW